MYPKKRLSITSTTVAGIAASVLLGLTGLTLSPAPAKRGVLPVRRLSRPLRRKGRLRAQTSSGGARCGAS